MRTVSPFRHVVTFLAGLDIKTEPVDELTLKLLQKDVENLGAADVLESLQSEFPTLHLAWGAATSNYLCVERHPFGIGMPPKPAVKLKGIACRELIAKLDALFTLPTASTMIGISRWLSNQNIEHELHRSGLSVFITLPGNYSFGQPKHPSAILPSGLPAVGIMETYGIFTYPHEVKETLNILQD